MLSKLDFVTWDGSGNPQNNLLQAETWKKILYAIGMKEAFHHETGVTKLLPYYVHMARNT